MNANILFALASVASLVCLGLAMATSAVRREVRATMTAITHRRRPRLVYVCHAFGADPEANAAAVQKIACELVAEGAIPVAPQIWLPALVDESTEREKALRFCLRLVEASDVVQVHGTARTEGMRRELAHARRHGIEIREVP